MSERKDGRGYRERNPIRSGGRDDRREKCATKNKQKLIYPARTRRVTQSLQALGSTVSRQCDTED